MRCRPHAFCLLFLLIWTACTDAPAPDSEPSTATAEASTSHDGIHWFEGSVDEAFAHAKAESRPVFLYWGAIWCPPCHYLKTKIFTQPEFVEASQRMVMVYLDGDTERAQIYGERFGVLGYPTVIVFDAGGEEMTRLPSTMPVDQYAEVLTRAMARLRPIKEIYAEVREGGAASADPTDLHLLAFYSWGQDRELGLDPAAKTDAFATFYRETPSELAAEKARFLSLYLTALAALDDEAVKVAADEKTRLREDLLDLLEDPAKSRANLDLVLYSGRGVVSFFHPEPSADRDALIAAWVASARTIEADQTLSVDDRLSALLPQVRLASMDLAEGEALPADLLDHVRERIAWAGQTVSDEGELQAVMSTMAGVLEEASLQDEAESLLAERMGEAIAPYYYMDWLASIKEKAGKTDEALELYRQAHATAEGTYTRFRYGSNYLLQLMDLRPEDAATIQAESERILDELLQQEDAFAGGNNSRLRGLARGYRAWNENGEHDAVLDALRTRVHQACDRFPEDGDQRERCASFLVAS